MEDSDSDSDSDSQGVSVAVGADFKINEEYARRFEYNKKREERQQCMRSKYSLSFQINICW